MAMNPRLLVPRATLDADAAAYLRAVEAADGQALETPVKRAVDDFIRGMKADGIWDAIKASCILCGARTISGALVPLVGAAPTAYSFASGDYDRSSGLAGDGATKYLDSNYAYAQNQDDEHLAIYRTVASTGNWIGAGLFDNGNGAYSRISFVSSTPFHASQGGSSETGYTDSTGFFALNRNNGTQFQLRSASTTTTKSGASKAVAGVSANYGVYVTIYDDLGVSGKSSQRAAFYSIGTSVDLSLLDTRVSTLVAAIAAAI